MKRRESVEGRISCGARGETEGRWGVGLINAVFRELDLCSHGEKPPHPRYDINETGVRGSCRLAKKG